MEVQNVDVVKKKSRAACKELRMRIPVEGEVGVYGLHGRVMTISRKCRLDDAY